MMKQRKRFLGICLCILGLIPLGRSANPDSLKNRVITDPYDSRCICHQIQALADKEYKFELLKEKKEKTKSSSTIQIRTDSKHWNKHPKTFVRTTRSKHERKSKRINLKRKDPSKCFHW